MTATEPNVIGRWAVVAYQGHCYEVKVIDKVAGTEQMKRVRIQNDPHLQDKVLQPYQYTFKCWLHGDEDE